MTFVRWSVNAARETAIEQHLAVCDQAFVPRLSARVELHEYSRRLHLRATRVEAWVESELIGLLAFYCNDVSTRVGFVSNVSVVPQYRGKGIAGEMVRRCIEHCRSAGMRRLDLEVDPSNADAIRLYERNGFVRRGEGAPAHMSRDLESV